MRNNKIQKQITIFVVAPESSQVKSKQRKMLSGLTGGKFGLTNAHDHTEIGLNFTLDRVLTDFQRVRLAVQTHLNENS